MTPQEKLTHYIQQTILEQVEMQSERCPVTDQITTTYKIGPFEESITTKPSDFMNMSQEEVFYKYVELHTCAIMTLFRGIKHAKHTH